MSKEQIQFDNKKLNKSKSILLLNEVKVRYKAESSLKEHHHHHISLEREVEVSSSFLAHQIKYHQQQTIRRAEFISHCCRFDCEVKKNP